jgi:hypothetical protein
MEVGSQRHAQALAALPWTGAENLAPTWIRSPDYPARSKSLYWLRYPGPNFGITDGNPFRALSNVRHLGHEFSWNS